MFVKILPQNANLINDLCFLYDSINVTRDEQAYLQSNKNTTFYNKNLFTKDRKDRKKLISYQYIIHLCLHLNKTPIMQI